MIGIYKITNTINNKVYIGQSWDIEKRFKSHRSHTHNKHLLNAFRKYETKNFIFEPIFVIEENLEKNITQHILDEKEQEFILFYDSINTEKGYNKKEGGNAGNLSIETKQKLSVIATKQFSLQEARDIQSRLTKEYFEKETEEEKEIRLKKLRRAMAQPEIRNKMSKLRKEENSKPQIRAKKSEQKKLFYIEHPEARGNASIKTNKYFEEHPEAREKASYVTKKQWLDTKFIEIKCRKVICVETGKIFNSIKEAYTILKISRTGIIRSCKTGMRAGGFHWKYAESKDNTEE